MLLGARQFFQKSAAGWQNPYVTNGLIAMWDGIWNVGGGREHDNSSKIWWDCVGGKPIILMSSKSAFGNLGVAQSAVTTFTEQIVGGAPGDDSSYGWRFAEYVITIGSVTTNAPYVLAIGRRGLWLNFSRHDIGVTLQTNAAWHSATALSAGSTFSVSADYNSEGTSEMGSAVWFNAASIQHTGASDGWNSYVYSPYAVGAFYNANYSFVGTYHAIRLYNRVLTQSEIDANYALDVQRFGIS